jgi:hypothetical protein
LRFSLAVVGMVIIFSMLMPITFWLGIEGGLAISRVGIVLVFMVLAAIVPTAVLTTEWRQLRLERHLREVVQVQPSTKQSVRMQGVALIGLFTLIFPLLAILVVPVALDKLTNLLTPSPPQLSDEVARINQAFTGLEQNVINRINELPPAIERAGLQNESESLVVILGEIESDSKDSLTAISETRQELEDIAEQEIALINALQTELREGAEAEAISNRKYLVFWSITVGLASFISVITALIAVESFVVSIDAQLPRPIFRRIANMMELALKELKESIGVSEADIDQIQWVKVQHNAQGGIDMIGIAPGSTGVDGRQSSGQGMAPTQHYFVRTDMWGWIQQTDIRTDGRSGHPIHYQTESLSVNHRSWQRGTTA